MEANEVARDMKISTDGFKGMISLLISLRDPALQSNPKPWKKIRKLFNPKDDPDLNDPKVHFHNIVDAKYTVGWIRRFNIID